MILVESTLGNLHSSDWHERSLNATVDSLFLEHWEAPRNRLRKYTENGVELAISLPRSEHLRDGDILYYDERQNIIIVARIALKDVLVIEMNGLETLSPPEILKACFELGHGLGNQHWPAVIKGMTIYVPLSVDQKVMNSVMRTHAFKHVTTYFLSGEEVAQKLDAKEMRLLFAGAEATPHHHHPVHDHAHDHSHDKTDGRDHDHSSHDDQSHPNANAHSKVG